MHCSQLCKLASHMGAADNPKALRVSLTKEKLSELSVAKSQSIYETPPDKNALQTRPWRNSPKYFTQALVSTLALVKMSAHAKSGGSIEVMGMLTGKIVRNSIIVMDVYALPVEGTETRVNAQNEAYEYMVQYLDSLRETRPDESIVGWYHSHPGYGCWLSGIDVATQRLNQNFQDPYLAIVVDPARTQNQGKVEIGAFRTFPDGYRENESENKNKSVNINKNKNESQNENGKGHGKSSRGESSRNDNHKSKLTKSENSESTANKNGSPDMGVHANEYYSLDLKLFTGPHDAGVVDAVLDRSWVAGIAHTAAHAAAYETRVAAKVEQAMAVSADSSASEYLAASAGPRSNRRYETLFERLVARQRGSGRPGPVSVTGRAPGNTGSVAANRGAGRPVPAGGAAQFDIGSGGGSGDSEESGETEENENEEIEENGENEENEIDYLGFSTGAGEGAADADADADSQYGHEDADEDDAQSILTRDYDGFGAAHDSDAMDEEDADAESSQGQNADADADAELGADAAARARDSGPFKGLKRNLYTSSEESKTGVAARRGPRDHRKRFAADDIGAIAAENELRHRMQSLQLDLQHHMTGVRQIGRAEILQLVGKRAQQRVFGTQQW